MAGPQASETGPSYFEGRWMFLDENCKAPTNWTMMSGGNFVSEDLIGNWTWEEGELVLRLDDLAIDEDTGEAGGRFHNRARRLSVAALSLMNDRYCE